MDHNSKCLAETAQFIWAHVPPPSIRSAAQGACTAILKIHACPRRTLLNPSTRGRRAPAPTVPSAGVKIKQINQTTVFPRKRHTQA